MIASKPKPSEAQIEAVRSAVCSAYGITGKILLSKATRHRTVTEARLMAYFIIKAATNCGNKDAAKVLGVCAFHGPNEIISWMRLYPAVLRNYNATVAAYWLDLGCDTPEKERWWNHPR